MWKAVLAPVMPCVAAPTPPAPRRRRQAQGPCDPHGPAASSSRFQQSLGEQPAGTSRLGRPPWPRGGRKPRVLPVLCPVAWARSGPQHPLPRTRPDPTARIPRNKAPEVMSNTAPQTPPSDSDPEGRGRPGGPWESLGLQAAPPRVTAGTLQRVPPAAFSAKSDPPQLCCGTTVTGECRGGTLGGGARTTLKPSCPRGGRTCPAHRKPVPESPAAGAGRAAGLLPVGAGRLEPVLVGHDDLVAELDARVGPLLAGFSRGLVLTLLLHFFHLHYPKHLPRVEDLGTTAGRAGGHPPRNPGTPRLASRSDYIPLEKRGLFTAQ